MYWSLEWKSKKKKGNYHSCALNSWKRVENGRDRWRVSYFIAFFWLLSMRKFELKFKTIRTIFLVDFVHLKTLINKVYGIRRKLKNFQWTDYLENLEFQIVSKLVSIAKILEQISIIKSCPNELLNRTSTFIFDLFASISLNFNLISHFFFCCFNHTHSI